ncbi:hypothetical protein LTR37_015094 [Vermiconidia calcicola]|uniref:Uncharacterized protein n=1 Tax=Vermiconidia calcicola TaxID=1690605 RepID=A0ACC3MTB9_9PEZI|nr:hypothetical protein LTR37_015094 [Vermiconidia calcicola]
MLVGKSLPEYVIIRLAIWALRLIAPISLLYCVVVLIIRPRGASDHRWPLPLEIWMIAEALFFLVVYVPLRTIVQQPANHPEPPPKAEREKLIRKCFAHMREPDLYLSKWFLDAGSAEIKRENVKEFYAWSLMNKTYEHLEESELAELDNYTGLLEERLRVHFEEGWGTARPLRGTLDSVPIRHRPLVWYIIILAVECYSSFRLLYNSFRFQRLSLTSSLATFPPRLQSFSRTRSASRHVSYWYRKHTSKSRAPILFIHGIGIGLYAYVDFLVELNKTDLDADRDGDVGIIAIELMSISSRIGMAAPSAAELREEIRKILHSHGWDNVVLIGHSYGSAVAANMLRDPYAAKYVKSALLMDPICFMLHMPDVAYNFTRRKPSEANEHMLHYFSSTDMMISHTIARRFFWSELVLFKEDLPPNMPLTVTLSGQDLIVPTAAVWAYLTDDSPRQVDHEDCEWENDQLKVYWFEKFDHAGLFASKGARRGIAQVARRHCE